MESKLVMEDQINRTDHIHSNELTPDSVKVIHKIRQDLQRGIQLADLNMVKKAGQAVSQILGDDELNILKRVPGNRVRSYKNILLSLNTLYSCEAENGGLSPLQCHLISEKYAVMIEHADDIPQLEDIHNKMLNEYANPAIRMEKSDKSIVEKTEDYIDVHFDEDISMEEMASKLHVHPSHLMRVFKKEKGITISKYRNLTRIKKAKELIASSNLSITDIAIMVGFSNPQYFSTFFREVEGITPLEFKKMKKNS